MTAGGEWRWDDSALKGEDVLYRRVPNDPKYLQTEDRFTGRRLLSPAALNLSEADYEAEPEDVVAVTELDPPPSDEEEVRVRLDWGKGRAMRAFRGWREEQSGVPQEHAGCSVQIESLMKRHAIPTSALADWLEQGNGVGRFTVQDVRDAGGGVVAVEDTSDPVLGKAHGLVRTKSQNMKPKPEWSNLRKELLKKAEFVAADPGYSGVDT